LEIFMIASPSGRCWSFKPAIVSWGNLGSLAAASLLVAPAASHPTAVNSAAAMTYP
jgi:hypothetical protein